MSKFQEPKYLLNVLVKSNDEEIISYYENYKSHHLGDSGIDLITPQDVIVYKNSIGTVDYQVACSMVNIETDEFVSYYMYPRSSISSTPFLLANSVGIIDAGYRGTFKGTGFALLRSLKKNGKFYNTNDKDVNQIITKGSKLCQICAPVLSPIIVRVVSELDETSRGSGGFGSTTKSLEI
jgi:dUTP pyrophosphatase